MIVWWGEVKLKLAFAVKDRFTTRGTVADVLVVKLVLPVRLAVIVIVN
jgi:hypothetical protein